jgi:exonuclease III
VHIFVREDQGFNKSDTSLNCAEQTLEVCAVELETKSSNLSILTSYRASSANLNQFIKRLDATLKYLYNPKSEFLICGDINVDCLNDNWKKKKNSLLTTHNLFHTVNFATTAQNDSSTANDTIFVDITRVNTSYTCPIINGLSDHDANSLQLITLFQQLT